jgi:hypothetical protein
MTVYGIELVLGAFALFFIALYGWWIYRRLLYKSNLGAELGAIVKTQVGESKAKAYESHPATLRVYQMTRPQTGSDLVGLEIRIPTASEYQRTSLTFNPDEARDLVALMEQALASPEAANKSMHATCEDARA